MPVNQYPTIPATPQFGPQKITGGFVWAVQFNLPIPAPKDGFIVQEVFQFQSGTTPAGQAVSLGVHFWEAWKVRKGEFTVTDPAGQMTIATFISSMGGSSPSRAGFHTPFNDIFFKQFAIGNKGLMTYLASAAFYEVVLSSSFRVHNPATGAGSLPSTISKPSFWSELGLFRALKFEFDFTSSRSTSNATLKTCLKTVGTVSHTNPPDADFRTHT